MRRYLVQPGQMQALARLAGGVAHEFNNILGAIIGYADVIAQTEELSSSARRSLETIRCCAVRGVNLTKSLQAFSRSDVGEKKPVSLKSLVEQALTLTEEELKGEGIEVSVRNSADVPPVMANSELIAQALTNIVTNARHAMQNSAVKKLTIEVSSENGRAVIKVGDTGCGIPKKDISRVFEPFFTTKGAFACGPVHDGKATGTGLGLSVCHSIVRAHGGEIKVRSRVGKGTAFTIYFPAVASQQTEGLK